MADSPQVPDGAIALQMDEELTGTDEDDLTGTAEIKRLWLEDLTIIFAFGNSVPEEYQWRLDADIDYFEEIKIRADQLVANRARMVPVDEEHLAGRQNQDMVTEIYLQLRQQMLLLHNPVDISFYGAMRVLLLMALWKSAIVESRGNKFVVGVTLRYLERYFLTDLGLLNFDLLPSSAKDVHFHFRKMYKAWSVLLTVKNTTGKYVEKGSRHVDMEKQILEVLGVLKRSTVFEDEVTELMEEDVYRFRGSLWHDRVEQKRESSEVLFAFLKVEGDLFTATEGGKFTITREQNSERDRWKAQMKKNSEKVLRQYEIDRDGRYYKRFGWRSVIVYFGTMGSLVLAAVVTALDLGDEGSNAFKRLNFFATLAVSVDLLVLGLFKIFDRNDKAVTDGIYLKRRIYEIDREFNDDEYKLWRKAIAFDASKVADAVSSTNTCYASQPMTGEIVSPMKMQFDEIVEMFYIIEHGYHKGEKKMVNIMTGRQYNLTDITETSSHIEPAPGYGLEYTGTVRKVRESDNIYQLGASYP